MSHENPSNQGDATPDILGVYFEEGEPNPLTSPRELISALLLESEELLATLRHESRPTVISDTYIFDANQTDFSHLPTSVDDWLLTHRLLGVDVEMVRDHDQHDLNLQFDFDDGSSIFISRSSQPDTVATSDAILKEPQKPDVEPVVIPLAETAEINRFIAGLIDADLADNPQAADLDMLDPESPIFDRVSRALHSQATSYRTIATYELPNGGTVGFSEENGELLEVSVGSPKTKSGTTYISDVRYMEGTTVRLKQKTGAGVSFLAYDRNNMAVTLEFIRAAKQSLSQNPSIELMGAGLENLAWKDDAELPELPELDEDTDI